MSQYVDETGFDTNLRLGDIIEGFSHIIPTFDDFFTHKNEFRLDIKNQQFFAILTPCCSIENSLITVVPLISIKHSFLSNDYFTEDLTRINRPGPPEKIFPPIHWGNLSEEEKGKEIEKGEQYAFFELFIYSPNDKFPQYNLKYKDKTLPMIFYMIDFKQAFTVTSKKIQRGTTYPKVLQLTIASRGELRNKLAKFYSRIPDEDLV
jgi:hypothetical protein